MAVGQQVNQGFALQDSAYVNGIAQGLNNSFGTVTAHAGGGAPLGTQVSASKFVNIGTVGTAADSILLPFATPGIEKMFFNNTATAATIYAQTANNPLTSAADSILSGATAATVGVSLSIPAGNRMQFICFVAGKWTVNTMA